MVPPDTSQSRVDLAIGLSPPERNRCPQHYTTETRRPRRAPRPRQRRGSPLARKIPTRFPQRGPFRRETFSSSSVSSVPQWCDCSVRVYPELPPALLAGQNPAVRTPRPLAPRNSTMDLWQEFHGPNAGYDHRLVDGREAVQFLVRVMLEGARPGARLVGTVLSSRTRAGGSCGQRWPLPAERAGRFCACPTRRAGTVWWKRTVRAERRHELWSPGNRPGRCDGRPCGPGLTRFAPWALRRGQECSQQCGPALPRKPARSVAGPAISSVP